MGTAMNLGVMLITHAGTILLIMTVEWYVGVTCIVIFDNVDFRVLGHVHTIFLDIVTGPVDCRVVDLLFVHVFFLFVGHRWELITKSFFEVFANANAHDSC